MVSVLLSAGRYARADFDHVLREIGKNVSVTVLYKEKKKEWATPSGAYGSYSFEQIENDASSRDNSLFPPFEKIIRFLTKLETIMIGDRALSYKNGSSMFHQLRHAEKLFITAYQFLHKQRPDFYLFMSTPHSLTNWAYACAAEEIGIEVLRMEKAPVAWRFRIRRGLTERAVDIYPIESKLAECEDLTSQVDLYLSLNRSDYKTGIPNYEKAKFEKRKGSVWSWRHELIPDGRSPRAVFGHPARLLKKRAAYDEYRKLSTNEYSNMNSIVLFLQLQPERTSIPEGGSFGQQWFVARSLANALPSGWKLLIKEHPSTFTSRYDEKYRSVPFYRDLAELPNTYLLSLETDPFELIDHAKAVATLTGTVGFQAICRGTPVLSFGNACYGDAPGVFSINDEQDLDDAIRKIGGDLPYLNKSELKKYFLRSCLHSTSGWSDLCVYDDSSTYQQVRKRGLLRLLKDFLVHLDAHHGRD